jgi:thymidylate synthase (FAD)
MKLINPSVELITDIDGEAVLRHLEIAIRNAYKSEDKISETSHKSLINLIMTSKHFSTLEHYSVTYRVICSRACMTQWIRHRVGHAYTIESQRFVNYNKAKFGKEITFIEPINFNKYDTAQNFMFKQVMERSERDYFNLLSVGFKPEDARNALNNAVKCEMVVTSNLRAILNFLKLRTTSHAQDEIRFIALQLQAILQSKIPLIFDEES